MRNDTARTRLDETLKDAGVEWRDRSDLLGAYAREVRANEAQVPVVSFYVMTLGWGALRRTFAGQLHGSRGESAQEAYRRVLAICTEQLCPVPGQRLAGEPAVLGYSREPLYASYPTEDSHVASS